MEKIKSPVTQEVEIKLTIVVHPEDVDAVSNELKAVVDKYKLFAGRLEQSEVKLDL